MHKSGYYPIELDLKGRKCVVIGAGSVAERKVKRLLECGASVRIVGPEVAAGLKKLAKNKKVSVKVARANLSDVKSAFLVICASSDRKINSSISSYCRKNNILVNVVDLPSECTFILPSIVKRGDLTISISTGGVSPALSKRIRLDLEKKFGSEYAKFLKIMKKLRPEVIKKIKNPATRKTFFTKAASSDIINLLKKNKVKEVQKKLERML